MTTTLDRERLLRQLGPVRFDEKAHEDKEVLKQVSLGETLLLLAEITPSNEYELCRSVAAHLLDDVPEPEDVDLEGD